MKEKMWGKGCNFVSVFYRKSFSQLHSALSQIFYILIPYIKFYVKNYGPLISFQI
jgi:hypothetical protein